MIINLAAPPYNALCSSYTNAVQRIIIMIVITSANTPFPPSGLIMFPLPKRDHHHHHHDFWPQSKVGSILRAVPLWQVLHSDGSLCTEYMLHWLGCTGNSKEEHTTHLLLFDSHSWRALQGSGDPSRPLTAELKDWSTRALWPDLPVLFWDTTASPSRIFMSLVLIWIPGKPKLSAWFDECLDVFNVLMWSICLYDIQPVYQLIAYPCAHIY